MNPQRWQEIKKILENILERSPAARSGYLDEACGSDEDLRREVENLLEFEEVESDLLEQEAFSAVFETSPISKNLIGRQIGNYQLTAELGAGGMGAVFLAERADGEFEQKAAVKLIKNGINSETIRRRFLNERQILASLKHPNIAHLVDGGTTSDGLPYFVMEYVEGTPINEYANANNLTLEQRLDLFREVCAAVSFAHQKLIIHRDLKPSNILITKDGAAKLLDFGIAKLLKAENGNETRTQAFAFTPEYASPEQIRGENLSTATDIYSLGVVLYELLTGTRPFRFEGKNIGEIIETVTKQNPAPPSAISNSKFQTSDKTNPKSKIRNPKLRGDLDNIVLKAVKKEPDRRYHSVERFSEDIRRYLKGLPVFARQDTWRYRAEKFVRRNPLVVAALLIALTALVSGIVAVGYQVRVAKAERAKAERRFNDVRTLANSFIFEVNEKIEESPIKARELLVERAVEYLDKLAAEAGDDESLQAELASAYEKIGDVQNDRFSSGIGDTSGALESHRKALLIRERLFSIAPDNSQYTLDLAKSYLKIADLSVTVGNTPTALENYQKAVSMIETVHQNNKNDADVRRELAIAYAKLGQGILRSGSLSESLEYYEKAAAISKSLAAENPANIKLQHNVSVYEQYIAYAKLEMGRETEALNNFSAAFEIERQIWENDRENIENRRSLSIVEFWMGFALRKLHRFEESLKHHQNALEIQQKIYDVDKSNVGEMNSLADCHLETGWTFSDSGNQPKAIAHFEKAIAFYEEVVRIDANNLSAQRQIAFTRRALGDALFKSGSIALANQTYERALRESEVVNQKDEKNSEFRHDKALCLLRIAEINMRDKAKAQTNLIQAIEILEKLVTESPEHKQRRTDLEQARNLLAKLSL